MGNKDPICHKNTMRKIKQILKQTLISKSNKYSNNTKKKLKRTTSI